MTSQPDAKAFRDAMRAFVGNCSVLTVGNGDQATGLVVTSGISLSAEPPLILACVNRSSSSWPHFSPGAVFGWSSLGAAHQGVAERFSGFGGVTGPARYDGADWETTRIGARLLVGAATAFACTVDAMIEKGTHSIIIGRIHDIRRTDEAGALIYWNGRYLALAAG